MSSILSTVGPLTVLKYLNFALGKPIGDTELEIGEPEAAVGLEHVANLLGEDKSIRGSIAPLQSTKGKENAASHLRLNLRTKIPQVPQFPLPAPHMALPQMMRAIGMRPMSP